MSASRETDSPRVSIVVRTKNRARLLDRALRSIDAQEYRPVEVVLVNDGGEALDLPHIESLLEQIELIYVPVPESLGRAGAANRGVEAASGTYVGFLDDDDEILPRHIGTMVKVLEDLDLAVAYSDAELINRTYNPQSGQMEDRPGEAPAGGEFSLSRLLLDNFIPLNTLLFRHDVLEQVGGFDCEFELYEDWDLLIRCAYLYPFYHVPEVTARYVRWHDESQIARKRGYLVQESYLRFYRKHASRISPDVLVELRDRDRERLRQEQESVKLEKVLAAKQAEIDGLVSHLDELNASVAQMAKEHEGTIHQMAQAHDRNLRQLQELDGINQRLRDRIELLELHAGRMDEINAVLTENQGILRELRARKMDEINTALTESLGILHAQEHRYHYGHWRNRLLRCYVALFPENTRRRVAMRLLYRTARHPGRAVHGFSLQKAGTFLRLLLKGNTGELHHQINRQITNEPEPPAPSEVDDWARHASVFLEDNSSLAADPDRNKILVIDRWVPEYDRDSGAQRMFTLLRLLAGLNLEVTLLPDDRQRRDPYAGELEAAGVRIVHAPGTVEDFLRESGASFSWVIISRPEQAVKFLPYIRAYAIHAQVIYDTVDIHWLRIGRGASLTGDDSERVLAERYRRIETYNAESADMVLCVTDQDRQALLDECPGLDVRILPNVHDPLSEGPPFRERKGLMFIGSFMHMPNVDAMQYFVKDIFPLIRNELPDVCLTIVGSDADERIRALASDSIQVTGYVRDVDPYFHAARVFVCPLRFGAGMKGKLGQSMAYGLPVVTTSVGAEGMGLEHNRDALIADEPRAFATEVVRLYRDDQLWGHLNRNAIRHLEREFSSRAASERLAALLDLPETVRSARTG